MGIPKIIPGDLYAQAGLPIPYNGRYSAEPASTAAPTNCLKEGMRNSFRAMDKQDAVNRYIWRNLPNGLTGQLIEEVLYHKGQGIFFYLKETDKFYFLPFALAAENGTGLDPYGRFLTVTPVPLAGGTVDKEGNAKPWIPGRVFEVAYDVILPEDLKLSDLTDRAVILRDYTPPTVSRTCIPRAQTQEGIIDIMSDTIPLMRTALINGVGATGIKVQSQDEQVNVEIANAQVQNAAINGSRYIPIINKLDMQELSNAAGSLDSENYMQALQSLDNLRLSLYGIPNGGVFAKNAHMLQSEQNMAGGAVGLVYEDGLTLRETFCDIVNSIWPLGMDCDIPEAVSGADKNMDGEISDVQDTTGTMPGNQPDGGIENEID